MNRGTAGVASFFLAGIVSLVGAVGATLGSIPALSDRLGVDPSAYWNNRLLATSILGSDRAVLHRARHAGGRLLGCFA